MALGACADPCLDDGLGQSACPVQETDGASGSSTGETDSNSNTITDSASASATLTAGSASMSGSASDTDTDSASASISASASASVTDSASDSGSASDTEGGTLWCPDADMDGFGDPEGCVNSMDPPPGTVDNDDDCDDGDADTFPGAAPNDDPDACMHDADGDDWGDDTPSGPGVEPGTDCDDADANTYTGAADIEDPSACMADGDDDGWGDADPPDGVTPGSDCVDGQAAINPDDSVLISMPTSTGEVLEVSLTDGAMTPIASVDVAMFDPWLPTSVAINPTDLSVVVALAMSGKLATMNYCGGGAPTEMAGAHNKELCGLAFDGAGKLYGVDGEVDQIVMFEPDGSIMPGNIKPLMFEGAPLNIAKCGMTYDCHNDRILLADSNTASIYAVNPGDGTTTRLAFIEEGAFGAGLAYEPVEQVALSCNGVGMYAIALDGSNTSTLLPDLAKAADDLEFAPACD